MSRELRSIVERFDALERDGCRAVLATVVDVRGSSYRLPGARMLVEEDGGVTGTVSGGCLEADLLERAKRVLRTGAAEVFVYDNTATDDSVFGLNMGCRGVIRVLLAPAEAELAEFFGRRLASSSGGALATVVAGEGGVRTGAWLAVDEWGASSGDLDGHAAEALGVECSAAIDGRRSRLACLDLGEVFVEYVAPPVPLVVFGAGRDALPLVRLAKEMGWRVTLVDHRAAAAEAGRIAGADEVVVVRPEAVGARVAIDDRTAAVLMTHNYAHDRELLDFLLSSPARYVGVLGPRSRTDGLLADLAAGGGEARNLERLYAPIGVDIGAETPEEIALSIVAEVRAVLSGRAAGLLRDRDGSIHGGSFSHESAPIRANVCGSTSIRGRV